MCPPKNQNKNKKEKEFHIDGARWDIYLMTHLGFQKVALLIDKAGEIKWMRMKFKVLRELLFQSTCKYKNNVKAIHRDLTVKQNTLGLLHNTEVKMTLILACKQQERWSQKQWLIVLGQEITQN